MNTLGSKIFTANNSVGTDSTVGEKAAAYLPVALTSLYTGLNALITNAAGLDSATIVTTRWVVWVVMIATTSVVVYSNNTKAAEKISLFQMGLTVVTFAAWSAQLGGVLSGVAGWDTLFGPLVLTFLSGVFPLIKTAAE